MELFLMGQDNGRYFDDDLSQGMREHDTLHFSKNREEGLRTVITTGTQSFINHLSYSLAQNLWVLLLSFNLLVPKIPNFSTNNFNLQWSISIYRPLYYPGKRNTQRDF